MDLSHKQKLVQQVASFLSECLVEGKTPATVNGYQYSIQRFIDHLEYAGEKPDRQGVISFLTSLSGLEPETRHRYFRESRRFFTWAIDRGLLEENPFSGLKNVRLPEKLVKPFSTTDVNKMLRVCSGNKDVKVRNRLIIFILLDTGMRRGELTSVELTDVNIDDRRIHIRNAKGGKQRVVPFAGRCSDALRDYLGIRGTQPGPLLLAVDPQGHLRNDAPLTASGLIQVLRRIGRLSRVERVNAHRFRHTFATWAVSHDAREMDVQYLLGHSSVSMVRRYTSAYRSEQAAKRHVSFSPGDQMAEEIARIHRS
jgi:integrase/recombinase XerC/integrase/recombinase XerD